MFIEQNELVRDFRKPCIAATVILSTCQHCKREVGKATVPAINVNFDIVSIIYISFNVIVDVNNIYT